MYAFRDSGVTARVRPLARRSRLELAIAPSAVRIARQWTAEQLASSDPPQCADLIDSAVLTVSELVTNAIAAVGQALAVRDRQATRAGLPLGEGPPRAGLPEISPAYARRAYGPADAGSLGSSFTFPGVPGTGVRPGVRGPGIPGPSIPGPGIPGPGIPDPSLPTSLARVSLLITWLAEGVRIEVFDSSCIPLPPTCQRDPDDEHGRGLTVVAALASSWGWRPEPCGKVVWCDLAGEP